MSEGSTDLTARMAVVEQRVGAIEHELEVQRQRWHAAETDRATLRLIVSQVESLAASIKELASSVPAIASEAAENAVRKMLEHRDELEQKRSLSRLQLVAVVTGVLGLGVTAGGLAVTLVAALTG